MRRHIPIILPITFIIASCSSSTKEEREWTEGSATELAMPPDDKIAEVTVMKLQPSVFVHEIVSNGHASAREKIDIYFPTTGVIDAIYVRNGQRVDKGQKLAALNTYKLRNQLDKDRIAVATATLELQDVLIGQGYDPEHIENVPAEVMNLARLRSGLHQAEVQLDATQHNLNEAVLSTPISGVVANLTTDAYNQASTTQPLCRIINDADMEVEFPVLESELPMVRPGDKISISPFSSIEARTGKVTDINPMVDENGMVTVWATVDGGHGLIDGMNVRVSVKRAVEQSLVVPKTAVVMRQGRQVVFTLDGDKARWNYVTTGLENLNEYTVTEGLEAGMTVIITGNINLAHETAVKVLK